MNWAVATIAPQRDGTTSDRLNDKAIPTFNPRFVRRAVKKGRHLDVVRPMFPGYLFVEAGRWRDILSTPGVNSLLTSQGCPAVVRSEVLRDIKSRCDRDGLCHEEELSSDAVLAIGAKVRIIAGALAGSTGSYIGKGRKGFSLVAIDIVGGSRISVRDFDLERAEAS